MTQEQVKKVAGILTDDAKHLLLTGEDKSLYGFAGAALILRGLVRHGYMPWNWNILVPTLTGKRVRQYLLTTPDSEVTK